MLIFNERLSFKCWFDVVFVQEEFRLHFKNISRIMDCVGCSKCRLWGTLQVKLQLFIWNWSALTWDENEPLLSRQTQGLGTALRILFSEKEIKNLPENSPSKGFQLTRQEIVALLNGFARSELLHAEHGSLHARSQ